MSNIETVSLASISQESTFRTGLSLAASLYAPTTIFLEGDLGAGKTTFVQGLGSGLGIHDPIVSPTYAIENRYGEKLLHMDLYRLDPKESRRLLEESEDFPGVRAVEWSERILEESKEKHVMLSACLPARQGARRAETKHTPNISIAFTEPSPTTRTITITFADIALPQESEIKKWREEIRILPHIEKHCDVVAAFAKRCSEELLKRGTIVRPHAVFLAGLLHDLLRFVDFLNPEDRKIHPEWVEIAERYNASHEETCARFVAERGYPELGMIIRPHGLKTLDEEGALQTIEQKILFYADKRVMGDKVVSLKERFDDFIVRYVKGTESEDAKRWKEKTEALEKELFGENIPS